MARTQRVMTLVELRGDQGVYGSFSKGNERSQADEKCCYHCSSPEHFICNCLLVKTSRDKKQLNGKEGMASTKGAWTPLTITSVTNSLQMEAPQA